ncbi:MAG: hypothetical protein Q9166_004604 [cf. Caloplaca sp. 2 TL-2023]
MDHCELSKMSAQSEKVELERLKTIQGLTDLVMDYGRGFKESLQDYNRGFTQSLQVYDQGFAKLLQEYNQSFTQLLAEHRQSFIEAFQIIEQAVAPTTPSTGNINSTTGAEKSSSYLSMEASESTESSLTKAKAPHFSPIESYVKETSPISSSVPPSILDAPSTQTSHQSAGTSHQDSVASQSSEGQLRDTVEEAVAMFRRHERDYTLVQGAIVDEKLLIDFNHGGYYYIETFMLLGAITDIPDNTLLYVDDANENAFQKSFTPKTITVIVLSFEETASANDNSDEVMGHWFLVHADIVQKETRAFDFYADSEADPEEFLARKACHRTISLIRRAFELELAQDAPSFTMLPSRHISTTDETDCGPLMWRKVETLIGDHEEVGESIATTRLRHCRRVVQALGAGQVDAMVPIDQLEGLGDRAWAKRGRDYLSEDSTTPRAVKKPKLS